MIFEDRSQAGRLLAERLAHYGGRQDVLVLGLPRGGVPVAFEVARALGAPLDVFVVRKLGAPGSPEFAIGAIAGAGVRFIDKDCVRAAGATAEQIEQITRRESRELARREALYRAGRPPPDAAGKKLILVDDGLATGATMTAAVQAARALYPARVIVAAPVGDAGACRALRRLSDELVCVWEPDALGGVGLWYRSFEQTTDEQVRDLLGRPRAA